MSRGHGSLQQRLQTAVYTSPKAATTIALAEALGCRPFEIRRAARKLVAEGSMRMLGPDRWAAPKAPREKRPSQQKQHVAKQGRTNDPRQEDVFDELRRDILEKKVSISPETEVKFFG